MRAALLLFVGMLLTASVASRADDAPISFKRDVAPILLKQCQTCHGPDKVKGGFRLDTFQNLKKPGSSGDASLTAGKPEKSEVYRLLATPDPDGRMPKKSDALPKSDIELIRKWIEQGSVFDGPEASAALSSYIDSTRRLAPETYPHPLPVTALAFSPEVHELYASGYHELTKWDAQSGKLVGRIPLAIERVQAIAIEPHTGRLAVVGGTPGVGGELLLIDPAHPAEARSLEKSADLMLAVRFSPDGKTFAAGGSDGAIRVFDTETGKRRWRLEPHADWVTDLAFSPDSTLLVTASRDKSCRVFEVKTGLAEASYLDHPEPVYAVVFSEDSKTVFSGGRDRTLHAWSAIDGKAQSKTPGFGGDILRLARVGTTLYSACGDGKVRAHATNKSEKPTPRPATEPATTTPAGEKKKSDKPPGRLLLHTMTASTEWVYALSADEKLGLFAAGSYDGVVHVWTVENAKPVAKFVAAPRLKN